MDFRAVVLAGLLVAALTGCGPDPAPRDAKDPEPTSPPTASSSTPMAPGGQVEFRVVLATDAEPAPDSEVLQQFESLDCGKPAAPAAADEATAACDDEGMKYSLEPAVIVGGIESASGNLPEGQVGWVVNVDLDPDATATFAQVTGELAGSMRQLAIVLDGRVVSAPTVESTIVDGQVQISGDFSEESAKELAERLAG